MKIYRETIGSKKFKKDLLYKDASMSIWNALVNRSMLKATSRGVGFQLKNFFPHSPFAFSVELSSGKSFRFQRVG